MTEQLRETTPSAELQDRAVAVLQAMGIELLPWQEAALRAILRRESLYAPRAEGRPWWRAIPYVAKGEHLVAECPDCGHVTSCAFHHYAAEVPSVAHHYCTKPKPRGAWE